MSDHGNSDDEDYRDTLEKYRVETIQSLDLDRQFMLSYLRSRSVLDDEDCQLINTGGSRQQKNSKFLDTIARRGPKAFKDFINALEFENTYLYKLFTGKDAEQKGSWLNKDKQWENYDREYLSNELARLSEQYRSLALAHHQSLKEKQETEKKMVEVANQLTASMKQQEELQFELSIKNQYEQEEEEQDKTDIQNLFAHCQELVQENCEKSNMIIALQARLLAVNEHAEKKSKVYEEYQLKNKSLMQQVKELTISYEFHRTESKRLKETVERSYSDRELSASYQRQIRTLKFELARTVEERDDAVKSMQEVNQEMTALNRKISFLEEQKDTESEMRNELSEEFLKLRRDVKLVELERDQFRSTSQFYKDKTTRLFDEISTYKEQIAFLSSENENTLQDRNRLMSDRENIMHYNNEIMRSRDEAVRNQVEITEKFEKKYKEASKYLEEARIELNRIMLENIRLTSPATSEASINFFTTELENTREQLRKNSYQEKGEETTESSEVNKKIRRNSSFLTGLIMPSRRKSAQQEKLTNSQMSMVFESVTGITIPFAAMFTNPLLPPTSAENEIPKSPIKRRITNSRGSPNRGKKNGSSAINALLLHSPSQTRKIQKDRASTSKT